MQGAMRVYGSSLYGNLNNQHVLDEKRLYRSEGIVAAKLFRGIK